MKKPPGYPQMERLLGIKDARSKHRLSILFWSSLVALLVSTAFVLGWFDGMELKTIDWRIRRHTPADGRNSAAIAIVAVTESDLHRLGESWPLPRKRYAQLVDLLHRHRAEVIAFGVTLPATPQSATGDVELARACRRAGNVVLAAYSPQPPASIRAAFDRDARTYDVSAVLDNAPVVSAAAAGTGHLNIFTDVDGTVRRTPAVIRHDGRAYLPLGAAAAALYATGRPQPPEWLRSAFDARGCLWISYRDPEHSIDFREDGGLLRRIGLDLQRPIELYSLAEVLGHDPVLSADAFKGKVVLVGCALNGFGSAQHSTPFGRQHGVFVQAAILDTALNGAPLRRLGWEASVAVTVLVTVAFGILFSRLEGRATSVCYIAAVALVIGASVLAFRRYGLIIDMVPPVTGVTISYAGALLIGLGMARMEAAKRNRELDAILEAGTASVALVGPELTGEHPLDMSAPGARIISSLVIPETTPQIVANTVGQAMHAGGCFLFLRDEQSGRMVPAASYRFGPGLDEARCVSVRRCLNRHVLTAGRPVLVRRPHTEPLGCTLPAQVKSVLLIPLTIDGETIGTVQLFNKLPLAPGDDGMFGQDDLRMATILGCQSAVSLQNARLYLERHDLFLNFVEAIATSVDLKDRYTHGHSKRVAEYSAGIAAELGFSRAEVELVTLAARLHDVGKIGTPDLLLRKRGRLTHQEFEVIKSHTTNAGRLFSGKPGWKTLVPGIRHHHERFNSTGYPDGLRGSRIPIVARIIAVADAYDAMTSDRPYRGRMEPAEACEEIKACSGSQFDPRIAAAFLHYVRGRLGSNAAPKRHLRGRLEHRRPLGAAAG